MICGKGTVASLSIDDFMDIQKELLIDQIEMVSDSTLRWAGEVNRRIIVEVEDSAPAVTERENEAI